jgi:hypothetical protein
MKSVFLISKKRPPFYVASRILLISCAIVLVFSWFISNPYFFLLSLFFKNNLFAINRMDNTKGVLLRVDCASICTHVDLYVSTLKNEGLTMFEYNKLVSELEISPGNGDELDALKKEYDLAYQLEAGPTAFGYRGVGFRCKSWLDDRVIFFNYTSKSVFLSTFGGLTKIAGHPTEYETVEILPDNSVAVYPNQKGRTLFVISMMTPVGLRQFNNIAAGPGYIARIRELMKPSENDHAYHQ